MCSANRNKTPQNGNIYEAHWKVMQLWREGGRERRVKRNKKRKKKKLDGLKLRLENIENI